MASGPSQYPPVGAGGGDIHVPAAGARWGVFCGLRPTTLPCHRTGATCRAGGPPAPTAAGLECGGGCPSSASAGALPAVWRWAGVAYCAKYEFSEGSRLWWLPGK